MAFLAPGGHPAGRSARPEMGGAHEREEEAREKSRFLEFRFRIGDLRFLCYKWINCPFHPALV